MAETPDDTKKKGLARVPTPKISMKTESEVLKGNEFHANMPPQYKLRRYYLPSEVAVHNTMDSCWVSMFNQVFDLTKLLMENHQSTLCDPIVLAGGTDISHWFHPDTREPKTFIDPKTGQQTTLCPTGRYLHVPPVNAQSNYETEVVDFEIPWWRDSDKYMIGRLTKKVRKITLMNTLTKDDEIIDVASEETMNEVLDRYMNQNSHAASYTWKRLGKVLDMEMNLADNGIIDESQECMALGIDPEEYIPTIHLYFDDDLTIQ